MAIKKVQLPDNTTQDINDARIASTDITQWNGKQDTLVSGTNIKTVNNESLLGSGNLSITGEPGDDGVGISSVVQTTESTVSGGTNVITVNMTDGTSSTFNVRNGDAVGSATIVQTTGDSTTAVMSQDGTTKAIAAGAQSVRVAEGCSFNNVCWTKLSSEQVAAINASEILSIHWGIRAAGVADVYRYARICLLPPYYSIRYSYFQTLSVYQEQNYNSDWLGKHENGDTSTTHYYNWGNQTMIINRITGQVKLYQNTTLIIDETSDDYKSDYFIHDDGYLGIGSGDTPTIFYALQIYPFDISDWFGYPRTKSNIGSTYKDNGKTVPLYISGNYKTYGLSSISERLGFYSMSGGTVGNESGTNKRYAQFVDGTAVSGTSKVSFAHNGSFTLFDWTVVITISGGTVSIPNTNKEAENNSLYLPVTVLDSNGDEVEYYTSISDGTYTVRYKHGFGVHPTIYYISGSPLIIIDESTKIALPCLVSMKFDATYDDSFVDTETGTEYVFYDNGNAGYTLSAAQSVVNSGNKYIPKLSNVPFGSPWRTDEAFLGFPPPSDGAILISSATNTSYKGIFIGDGDEHVWKKVNNA